MQACGAVAYAAAVAYMSLLVGRAVPEGMACFADTNVIGTLTASALTTTVLDKAREYGITTIFSAM
jgi:hypothetical protein